MESQHLGSGRQQHHGGHAGRGRRHPRSASPCSYPCAPMFAGGWARGCGRGERHGRGCRRRRDPCRASGVQASRADLLTRQLLVLKQSPNSGCFDYASAVLSFLHLGLLPFPMLAYLIISADVISCKSRHLQDIC